MIYLLNIPEAQVAFIPRNGVEPLGDLVFKAKSTIDLAVEVDLEVTDQGSSEQYYNLAIELPEGIPNGEYEYTLYGGDRVLSTGLMVVGDSTDPSEYNKDVTYEQYETE